MISLLWAADIDGEPMTFEIMESYCAIMFIAGLDTVVNSMGFGVRHLAANPDLQDELRGDPEAIADRVEGTAALLRLRRADADPEAGLRVLRRVVQAG